MQTDRFGPNDADQWFIRNLAKLEDPAHAQDDPVLHLIERQGLKPRTVYEWACANGWRLEAICERYGAWVEGSDLSALAVHYGRARWGLELECRPMGLGNAINPCELVIVSFVCHWLPRESLLEAVTAVDRSVEAGGHLIVADFDPPTPVVVPYHHREGLFTYKLPGAYSGLFLASGLYHDVHRVIFDHDCPFDSPQVAPESRAAAVLLKKEGR